MCKSIDAAAAMVNYAIDLAQKNNDSMYLMDYVKLHKLLYLAQSYILARYNIDLFEEDITAHNCGPYVDGIGSIPVLYGYGSLSEKMTSDEYGVLYLPLSYSRKEAVEVVMRKFGTLTADQLVVVTKNTTAYKAYAGNYDAHLPIERNLLAKTGIEQFAEQ